MKTASYHLLEQPHAKAVVFEVKKQHEDGTVDLHDVKSGELKVGRCKVSKSPVHGQCVLDDGKAAPAPKVEPPAGSGSDTAGNADASAATSSPRPKLTAAQKAAAKAAAKAAKPTGKK